MKATILKLIAFATIPSLNLCFVAISPPLNAQTVPEIAKSAFSSTVLIVAEDQHGQALSIGSGFFVANNIVATNLHVIEGSSRGYIKIIGSNSKSNIEGIVAIDQSHDLVLIKVDGEAPPLPLGDSSKLAVGQTIFAVGNPKGLEGTFSSGIISSLREFEEGLIVQITAPISPGSSGGPILNETGKAVGISVATYKGGQNLNFAIPVNYLTELLKTKPNKTRPLDSVEISNRKSSISRGEKLTTSVEAHTMTWDWEAHVTFDTGFAFSIRNELREAISNVTVLIIFKDKTSRPLDAQIITLKAAIPAGLAKRVKSNLSDGSMKRLTSTKGSSQQPEKRQIEFRILDFEFH